MSIATQITRLNNNINDLKQTKQDIKAAVNNDFNTISNEQIESYATKIEDTFELYKDFVANTASNKATELEINDAMVYSKNKIAIEGNTAQDTLTGKNFANATSEFVITRSQRYRDVPCVAEAGNYIASIENWVTDGSDTVSAVMLINSENTTIKNFQFSNTTKSVTCNISSDVAKIRIYSQSGYQTSGSGTTTITNLMFRKSTEDDTYEPYCGRNT